MATKNIAAYTAPGAQYPEYISINEHEKGVSITVRQPATAGTDGIVRCGEIVEIIIDEEKFYDLVAEMMAHGVAKKLLSERTDPNQGKLNLGGCPDCGSKDC